MTTRQFTIRAVIGAVTAAIVAVGVMAIAPAAATAATGSPSAAALKPGITLSASASPTAVSKAGTAITWSATVKNSGDVSLTGLKVVPDAYSGSGAIGALTCGTTSLGVGASTVCSGSSTTTQADIDSGTALFAGFVASATATGGGTVRSNEATAAVVVASKKALTVSTSANGPGYPTAGKTVTFTYTVRNSGTVTLRDPAIVFDSFSGTGQRSAVTCAGTTLLPSQSITCVLTYPLTQADIDAGSVTSVVHATASAAGSGAPVSSTTNTSKLPLTQNSQLNVTATGPGTIVGVGSAGTITYTVANTGNTTVAGLGIGTSGMGTTGVLSPPVCQATALAPGGSTTCTQTYTVAESDFDSGTMTQLGVLAWAVGQNPVTAAEPYSTSVTVGFYVLAG